MIDHIIDHIYLAFVVASVTVGLTLWWYSR